MRNIQLLLIIISLLTLTSAVYISTTPNQININAGATQTISINIVSHTNISSSPLSISPDSTWFSNTPNFKIISDTPKTISMTLTIPQQATPGYHIEHISYNGTETVLVLNITNQESTGCYLYYSPYQGTYYLKQGIQGQGSEIDIFASSGCSSLTFNSAKATSGTALQFVTTPQQGLITQGKEYSLTPTWDTSGVSTGTYNLIYQISAQDNRNPISSLNIPLTITVQQGTTPLTNLTSSDLPTCSLDSSQYSLKSIGTLTCSNINANIIISPQPNQFISGEPVSSENPFIWKFTPIKLGITNLTVYFKYKNAPIGKPYTKQIRITSTGTATAGTSIIPKFFPPLNTLNGGQKVVIQAVDNLTNSLLTNAKLYLDGVLFNGTTKLLPERNYTLRISDVIDGYQDYVGKIALNPKSVIIKIPNNLVSDTPIKIQLNPKDSTLSIDGDQENVTNGTITTTLTEGTHLLVADSNGYVTTKENITVIPSLTLNLTTNWKENVQQIILINRKTNWTILYAKSSSSQYNPISSGVGTRIVFTPQNTGLYEIQANDIVIGNFQIKSSGIKKFLSNYWAVILILLIIGFVIFLVLRNRGGGGYIPGGNFSGESLVSA